MNEDPLAELDSRFALADERLDIVRSTRCSRLRSQAETNGVGDRRFSRAVGTDDDLHRRRMKFNGEILLAHEVQHVNFLDLPDGVRSGVALHWRGLSLRAGPRRGASDFIIVHVGRVRVRSFRASHD